MREIILAANWKMHKIISEGIELVECLKQKVDSNKPKVIICPPFTILTEIKEAMSNSDFQLGAQNLFYEKQGAFTGEISPIMLKDTGAQYVIIGHSERRHVFGETNSLINKKLIAALENNLLPIFCIGETIEERKSGQTEQIIGNQLLEGLKNIEKEEFNNIIIAYEPVWAIGTGVNATPEQASEVHKFIRNRLDEIYKLGVGTDTTILYGGSIKDENIKDLAKMDEIDGGLVGGASLDCETFSSIWKKLKNIKNI